MTFDDPLFQLGMRLTNGKAMGLTTHEKYDAFVEETAIFAADRGVQYCVTKLNGEVGEFNAKLAKILQDSHGFTDYFFESIHETTRASLILELGDIVWYCAALSQQLLYNFRVLMEKIPDGPGKMQDGVHVLTYGLMMSGIAGSVAERSGKVIRDKNGDGTNQSYHAHWQEYVWPTMRDLRQLVDIVDRISINLDSSLEDVISRNVEKLESRRKRNVLRGSGDNR